MRNRPDQMLTKQNILLIQNQTLRFYRRHRVKKNDSITEHKASIRFKQAMLECVCD